MAKILVREGQLSPDNRALLETLAEQYRWDASLPPPFPIPNAEGTGEEVLVDLFERALVVVTNVIGRSDSLPPSLADSLRQLAERSLQQEYGDYNDTVGDYSPSGFYHAELTHPFPYRA